MRIAFQVEGTPVEFRRNGFTGRASLQVGGAVVSLQAPLDPTTHVSLSLTKRWRHRIGDSEVVIEKTRPLVFAGFRPCSYRALVDGQVVAERRGY